MMEMKEPIISERFDVDDIRKIREYNAARYKNMTTEEIIREIHEGAEEVLAHLKKIKTVQKQKEMFNYVSFFVIIFWVILKRQLCRY